MEQSFSRLLIGIAFAVIIVYLLMVVNFQSWLDPFHHSDGTPGGVLRHSCGCCYVTHTTFSVPSLMGSIMTIGVATANSILLVVFANDQRAHGLNPFAASLQAGYVRLRPVCMTALAMILGMLPMALALGEGGEQNAPLGRAVIGGLAVATVGTLFIVPIIYSLMRGKPPVDYDQRIDLEYKGQFDPAKMKES